MLIKKFIKRLIPQKRHFTSFNNTDIALPKVVEIEPTNTCNLKCKMCHVSSMKHNQTRVFDISLLPKLSFLKKKWVVIGSNFEPLMHPQFGEIIKYLSDIDSKIDITTNGTLLTEKKLASSKTVI